MYEGIGFVCMSVQVLIYGTVCMREQVCVYKGTGLYEYGSRIRDLQDIVWEVSRL